METFSYIVLTFNDELVATDTVSFEYGDGDSSQTVTESWAPVRYESGKVPITDATDIVGEASAINFVKAFNSDYNVSNLFIVERDGNEVTIKCTLYGIDFDNISVPESIDASTQTGTVPFEITDVSFTPGSVCSKITVTVTTSLLADEIIEPIEQMPTTNPIVFEYDRGLSFDMHVRRGTEHKYRVVGTPSNFFPSGINLIINDNPAGSSVEIRAAAPFLEFTYSLDGINYQSGNVFSNLIGGTYRAYVKDQYGCVTYKDFELDSFGINIPFFYVSETNSIRFANRVTWADCGNYKNDFNTLSCEADVKIPYKEIQQFQACDVITTQFKSNYVTNAVSVNGVEFPLTKKTSFMRRKDKRDAVLCNLGDGSTRTGIYFNSGNLYDYDTGDDIGDYTLNGALPEWGKAGNYVKHPNGNWYLIEDVVYLESKAAEVLVISTGVAPIFDFNTQVSCFYNLQNYEVYEFTIDFEAYNNSDVEVRILATDSYFDDLEFLSELIMVRTRHLNTVEVQYSNNENTDIYYATGIFNKIRMPLESKVGKPIDETEIYNTDTDTILLSTDVRKSDVFTFGDVTKQMMWKLVAALSHSNVRLDGVDYVKQSIEVDNVSEQTNLYSVKATMILASSAYRSGGLQFDESGVEIPALIPTGGGYVKYQ